MGSLITGIGLISGIDIATLINNLMAIEARGKVSLQQRLAELQAQQTAMLDINARLLNFKNAAAGFRSNSVFDAATATSSDTSILTATAAGAVPGTYNFIVKQLVANSQKLSKGFTDTDTTPVGLSSLTFEIGKGQLSTVTDLADLNGGTGVRRGKIVITDSASNVSTIDLSKATTINDVLQAINNDTTVSVTATAVGDHLEVTDNAFGTVTIDDDAGDFTATDLGIAKTGSPIIGDQINTLGSATALESLNDGTGVWTVDANPDLRITTKNGRMFDIDLGRIDAPITDATLLADLNNGLGVRVNPDQDPDIKFVAQDGTEYEVDLTGLTTVGAIRNQIDSITGSHIQLSIHADGNKFTVTDTIGGAGNLKVLGAGPNQAETAQDLGILNIAGEPPPSMSFDGQVLKNADYTPAVRTIQEVIDRINNAKDIMDVINGGHIVASIGSDGVSLRIDDMVPGGGNLKVESTTANPYAARDLGIEADVPVDPFIDGKRLLAGINSVLVRSLNGGAGLSGNTSLTIRDRTGSSDTFTIDENGSVSDILAQINASGSIQITASLNDARNGLLITDTSASEAFTLQISGSAAPELGIAADVAANSVRGTNLQLRYVAEGTKLSQLNYGRGIGTGSFRITDKEGDFATINIGSDSTNVYDVIDEINKIASANSIDITARINVNGDGVQLDNDLGSGFIRVDTVSGTTAKDLRIEGQAATDGGSIDGSYETTVTFNASDTVDEVVTTINSADIPVLASVLNTGAGPTPFQINFTSEIGGAPGELVIDDGGFGLGITTLTEGTNAKVFFGSADPADGILIERPSNSITDVVEGVTIDLVQASDTPVTVTVARDTNTIMDDVDQFVTTFNDAIDRINQYDFFDVDTETKGVLLGDPTTARVRDALYRVVQGPATGIDTQYRFLSQVGITVGAEGRLVFDRAKFQAAYDDDADAVENLFTAFKSTTVTTEEVAPGVTTDTNEQTFTELGFGDLFDQLLDGLTNSLDGAVTLAADGFDNQIDLTQKRIEDFDERLAAKRGRLEREFIAMETALAQIQSQNNAIFSLISNLSLAQNFVFR